MDSDKNKKITLWKKALKQSVPSWFPEKVVDSQVNRLMETGIYRDDYKNLNNYQEALSGYLKENNPEIPDPQQYASGLADKFRSPNRIGTLQRMATRGGTFDADVDSYWPPLSKVTSSDDGDHVSLRRGERNVAKIQSSPLMYPDVVGHELEHTRQLADEDHIPDKETIDEIMNNLDTLEKLRVKYNLPHNMLDNTHELLSTLVGKESSLVGSEGEAKNHPFFKELFSKMPKTRDWYVYNRLKANSTLWNNEDKP